MQVGHIKCKVTREQLPVTGAYSITDYKAQGSTFKQSIIDLAFLTASAGAYVMLSRLTSSAGLYILRDFPLQNLNRPFSKELIDVLERLKSLEDDDSND